MKILVINCGSSSIKFQLYDAALSKSLAKGTVGRIGGKDSYLEREAGGIKQRQEAEAPDHAAGFDLAMKALLHPERGVIRDLSEIAAVGHRVVHGGEAFTGSALITADTVTKLEALTSVAPLHNPPALAGIAEARRILPGVPHVAVFDTTFHRSVPPKAFLYPLPYAYYETHKIRKYGFHGTSCRYVSQKAAEMIGRPLEALKMVLCHLGNGVTVAAIRDGRSVDTSMGLTPLEGLMMGTRSGDIDPGVIFFLQRRVGLSIDRIDDLLNRESGLLGVSGVSNDMEEIKKRAASGDERCRLAIEMFAYRIKKYVGAYAAAMGGIDTLVFSAGIGENSPEVRAMICEGLEFLGIEIDREENWGTIGLGRIISRDGSRVKVLVIRVDEEEIIALDTLKAAGLSLGTDLPGPA